MGTMSLNYGGGDNNWIGKQGVHEGGGTYIANIFEFGTHTSPMRMLVGIIRSDQQGTTHHPWGGSEPTVPGVGSYYCNAEIYIYIYIHTQL